MYYWEKFKQVRELTGLSMDKLVKDLSFSKFKLSRFENNIDYLTDDELKELTNLLEENFKSLRESLDSAEQSLNEIKKELRFQS